MRLIFHLIFLVWHYGRMPLAYTHPLLHAWQRQTEGETETERKRPKKEQHPLFSPANTYIIQALVDIDTQHTHELIIPSRRTCKRVLAGRIPAHKWLLMYITHLFAIVHATVSRLHSNISSTGIRNSYRQRQGISSKYCRMHDTKLITYRSV